MAGPGSLTGARLRLAGRIKPDVKGNYLREAEMNIYQLIGDMYMDYADATPDDDEWPYLPIFDLCCAWNALAPDWSKAPEWARWMTIFDNGKRVWWECEPMPRITSRGEYEWIEKDGLMGMARAGQVDPLPLGVDWRLCKWERPEVAR